MSELVARTLSGLSLPSPATTGRRGESRDRQCSGRPYVVEEQWFRSALIREAKRADRFEQPFVLALVTVIKCVKCAARDRDAIWPHVLQALAIAQGDTDVLGWVEPSKVVGMILPEVDGTDPSVTGEIRSRISRELAARLDPDALSHVRVNVRAYGSVNESVQRGTPPLDAAQSATRRFRANVKRVFDVVGSLLLLALLWPVCAVLAALVWFTSAGPVFYRQPRVGKNGRLFRILKFRTMFEDASEPIHRQYVQQFIRSGVRPSTVGTEAVFKIVNDPRVTPLGRVLT